MGGMIQKGYSLFFYLDWKENERKKLRGNLFYDGEIIILSLL